MSTRKTPAPRPAQSAAGPAAKAPDGMAVLLEQYGCGPIPFAAPDHGLYDRHLVFDNVVDPAVAGARERFEAVARSVRDLLSQRWLQTEADLRAREPQAGLLPVDGVPHRPVAGQQHHQPAARAAGPARPWQREAASTGIGLLEQEPDAGLGNGGLGRLAACFIDSLATLQLPAMGYGLRYEYGIFRQAIENGWQQRAARQLAAPARSLGGGPARRGGRGRAELLVRDARAATARRSPASPSTLIGIPYDRPVVGYGGKTINTLRLWAAAAPDYFDFERVQPRRLRRRRGREADRRDPDPRALSRRLDAAGPGAALRAGVLPRRLLAGRHRAALPADATPTGARCPTRSPSSSTTRTPPWPSPS